MLQNAVKLVFHWISIGAYGIGYYLSQPGSFFEKTYPEIFKAIQPIGGNIPQAYNSDVQIFILAVWLLFFGTLHFFLQRIINKFDSETEKLKKIREANIKFSSAYYSKLGRSLNNKTLNDSANKELILFILEHLRSVLDLEEKNIVFRANIMVPIESTDQGRVLKLAFWSESCGKKPAAAQVDKMFKPGEGLAGKAWLLKEPIGGSPKNFWFVKNKNFVTFTRTVKHFKSFCSIPIFAHASDGLSTTDVIAILNIDCSKQSFFPSGGQRLAEYVDNIGLYINPLTTHMELLSSLVLMAVKAE